MAAQHTVHRLVSQQAVRERGGRTAALEAVRRRDVVGQQAEGRRDTRATGKRFTRSARSCSARRRYGDAEGCSAVPDIGMVLTREPPGVVSIPTVLPTHIPSPSTLEVDVNNHLAKVSDFRRAS